MKARKHFLQKREVGGKRWYVYYVAIVISQMKYMYLEMLRTIR